MCTKKIVQRQQFVMAMLFTATVVFGLTSMCLADQSIGGAQQRSSLSTSSSSSSAAAAAAPLTPGQKINAALQKSLPALPLPPPPPSQLGSRLTKKTPCTCGVFLSSQFTKGSNRQPNGYAVLLHEQNDPVPCNALGVKTCTNKCLEIIAKHLPNSPAIICGSVDRDVYKERAHLFVKNCNDSWTNTLLSTGKEFCCKDGQNYKCPMQ